MLTSDGVTRPLGRVVAFLAGEESAGPSGPVRSGERSEGRAGPPTAACLTSAQNGPRVRVARGGRSVRVKIPQGGRCGGGARRRCREFSARSRHELLHSVNALDRRRVSAGQVFFVTLTMPGAKAWCEFQPAAAKRFLKRIVQRLRRVAPEVSGWWKLEPQRRGAPHFHLLLVIPLRWSLGDMRDWWRENWFGVVGDGQESHREHGAHVGQVRTWNGVAAYAAKYLGKGVQVAGWEAPGRFWGVINRPLLPVEVDEVELSEQAVKRVRRTCVRWFNHQWGERVVRGVVTARRLRWRRARGGWSGFMPADVLERILGWAGVDVEGRNDG